MIRWIRADLYSRRGQAITVVLVVAGVVTALLLSAALLQGATNPWQGRNTTGRFWRTAATRSPMRERRRRQSSTALVLRGAATPAAARARLDRRSGGRLDISQVANPADQFGVIRFLIAGVIIVLALTGLANLITASVVGLRDHLRDVRVLGVMGLTPAQVLTSLIARSSVLALVAVTAGVSLGLSAGTGLINIAAQAYGLGSGIGRPPAGMTLAIATILAVTIAALTAAVPAHRCAEVPASSLLGPWRAELAARARTERELCESPGSGYDSSPAPLPLWGCWAASMSFPRPTSYDRSRPHPRERHAAPWKGLGHLGPARLPAVRRSAGP